MSIRLSFSEPKLVGQASPEVKGWGPYQFPSLTRLEDGRIIAGYHVEADSATAYGLPCAYAIYDEEAGKWTSVPHDKLPPFGHHLPNGDIIKMTRVRSIPLDEVSLPAPTVELKRLWVKSTPFYSPDKIPPEYDGWYMYRLKKGETEFVRERFHLDLPEYMRYTTSGVLPIPSFDRIFTTKDGRLISYYYHFYGDAEDVRMRPDYIESDDNGVSWRFISTIPYQPDADADEFAALRDGFSEPCTIELQDGSFLTVMRSDDMYGPGPMYLTRSVDGLKNWSKPIPMDKLGVYPQLLTLDCGATILSYGRPGLFVRATSDPACESFEEPFELLPKRPGDRKNTCSYTALMPLSANTFMIAYSDFEYPNKDGVPVKSILTRVGRVE